MNAPEIYKQFAQGLEPNPLNHLSNSMCLHGRHIKPQIMEVFLITKLDKLFRIYNTRNDAMSSFNT